MDSVGSVASGASHSSRSSRFADDAELDRVSVGPTCQTLSAFNVLEQSSSEEKETLTCDVACTSGSGLHSHILLGPRATSDLKIPTLVKFNDDVSFSLSITIPDDKYPTGLSIKGIKTITLHSVSDGESFFQNEY